MLKRKLYWLALGVVVSHASIAALWNGGKPQSFGLSGDCADCGAATQISFPTTGTKLPINQNLNKNLNAFAGGNGVGTGMNVAQIQSAVAKRANPIADMYAAEAKNTIFQNSNLLPQGFVPGGPMGLPFTRAMTTALNKQPVWSPIESYIYPYKSVSDYSRFENAYVNQNAVFWNGQMHQMRY